VTAEREWVFHQRRAVSLICARECDPRVNKSRIGLPDRGGRATVQHRKGRRGRR
jgi:hypothetical protein